MREIRTSGLMSGEAKRIASALPRLSSTLQIKGRKRHIAVDTTGLLMHVIVHAADIRDRDGGAMLMATMFGVFRRANLTP
jgi:hypothetical protein